MAQSFISAEWTKAEKVNFIPGVSALIWSFSRIPNSKGIFRLSSRRCETGMSKSSLSETDKIPAAVYSWQQGAHLRLWGLSERAGKLNPVTTVYSYPDIELTSGRLRKHAVAHLID